MPSLRLAAFALIFHFAIGNSLFAEDSCELTLQGEFRQGNLLFGTVDPKAIVTFGGQNVEVYDDGRFLLGLLRNAPAEIDLLVFCPSGELKVRTLTITQRTYNVQRIDGVNQSRVTPPAEDKQRILRENQEVRAARSVKTNTAFFDAGWIWPVSGPITGVYGSERIYNGTPGSPHWGIDIAAPQDTPILAPSDGVVRLVHHDNYFAGGLVILDHGYGLTSSFLHMQSIATKPGEQVKKGDILGTVGSTGRSTGPHLDWRINLGPETRVDVTSLPLPAMP